jgi:hypothetical protein
MENEENLVSHEVSLDGQMFDDVMAFLAENYPNKNLADVCVNFKVWSEVLAKDIGLIFDEAE